MGGYKTPNFLQKTLQKIFLKKMDIYCSKDEKIELRGKYEEMGWEFIKENKNHGSICLHFQKKFFDT